METSKAIYCALCDAPITNENDSREHLIANAIGGRRKVRGFICRSCNGKSGETWDAALAEQLNPLSLLLRITRERGNVPAQKFGTIGGDSIRLNATGRMDLPKPEFQKIQTGDKIEIRIKARSTEEAEKMLKGLKKKHPNLDVEKTLSQMVHQSFYLEDPLKISFEFGGTDAGRALVKSALALAVENGIAPASCKNAIRYLRDKAADACFGYYYESDLVLNRPKDAIFHCVAISNNPQTGQLLAYVEYFGVQRMVICLSDAYAGPDVHDAYAIDPISGKEFALQFNISLTQEELAAIYRYEKIPPKSIEQAFHMPLTIALKRDFEAEKDRVLTQAVEHALKNCGAAEGEMLTEAHIKKMTGLLMEKLMPFLRRHRSVQNIPDIIPADS